MDVQIQTNPIFLFLLEQKLIFEFVCFRHFHIWSWGNACLWGYVKDCRVKKIIIFFCNEQVKPRLILFQFYYVSL